MLKATLKPLKYKKWFFEEVEFIYHGEWCDPELVYHDYVYSYVDVIDMLYTEMLEEGFTDLDVYIPTLQPENIFYDLQPIREFKRPYITVIDVI